MDSRDIIASVKKYPVLYDLCSQRTLARRDAWKEVAAELNADVASVQRKWKNLRDSYVKYLSNASMAFRLDAEMKFLNPYLQIAKLPNVSANSNKSRNFRNRRKQVEEADSDDDENTSLKSRKRKVKTPNYNESDSGSESSEFGNESDSSTNTIGDDVDHLKLNQSVIMNSAIVDEKFVDFANRVKKLSQNNILTILSQISQIIVEKEESTRGHSKDIKIKLK
ncbi:uncharacterized protein LOC109542908 [Dendroctonus ponderosae]